MAVEYRHPQNSRPHRWLRNECNLVGHSEGSTKMPWFGSERLVNEVRTTFDGIDKVILTIVIGASVSGFVVLLGSPQNSTWHTVFVPEQVTLLHMTDSTAQRMAYFVFFAGVGICSSLLPFLTRMFSKLTAYQVSWTPFLGEVLAATLTILTWERPVLIIFSVMLVALTVWAASYRHTLWAIRLSTLLVILLAIMPGVLCTPVPDPRMLSWIDFHYSVVLSQGDRLAAGRLLYVDNTPHYGVLIPVTIALIKRGSAALTFGGLVRLVQVGQVFCLLAFLTAAWVRMRGAPAARRALGILLATLVVAPWTSTVSTHIWYPNISGLRVLMLPVAVLVSEALVSTRFLTASALIGTTTGLALLYNLETGLAITAGLGLAWLLRSRSENRPRVLLSALVGIASTFILGGIFVAIYYQSFGAWMWPISSDFLLASVGGYGGLPLKFNALALLIVLHAGYVFSKSIYAIINRNSENRDPTSAAIATILLVWFPYYMNRPDAWYLWSYLGVYCLLILKSIAEMRQSILPIVIIATLSCRRRSTPQKIEFMAISEKRRLSRK